MADQTLLEASRRRTREIIEEYSQLLAVPTTAADVEGRIACASLISEMLRRRGFGTRRVELPGAAPMVVGKLDVGASTTLALYSHYDGQPVAQPGWANDPWTATLYDGRVEGGASRVRVADVADWTSADYRLYARCASDDKAPTQALCSALDILAERGEKPAVNLLVIAEGEEECGSPNFLELLAQVPEAADAAGWLVLDGPKHQTRRPQIMLGARGVVTLQMTVFGPTRVLHSGHYGNWVPNPAMRLVHLIASMRDERGMVTIEGFGEGAPKIGAAERALIDAMPASDPELLASLGVCGPEDGESGLIEATMRPSINLHGIQAGQVRQEATNAIMERACSSMDIRLVPDQTIAQVKAAVEDHIRRRGFHIVHEEPGIDELRRYGKTVLLSWGDGYEPARSPIESPFARALLTAAGSFAGDDLVVSPMSGASVPIRRLAGESGKPAAILPIANHDNNQHGANENIRVQDLVDGVALYAAVLSRIRL